MPERWRHSEWYICAASLLVAACAIGGAVTCAAEAVWYVTPHASPPAAGEFRCGEWAIVVPFAALFGGVVGAVGGLLAGTALAATLLAWGRLRRWRA